MTAPSLVTLLSESVLALAVVAVAVLPLRAAVAVTLAYNQHTSFRKNTLRILTKISDMQSTFVCH